MEERLVRWDADSEPLRRLFATTWKKHPVLEKPYFDWLLTDVPAGKAISYCTVPKGSREFVVGVYMVSPVTIFVGNESLLLSTSLKTMTHPEYYKRGIFVRLAKLVFDECLRGGVVGTIGVPNNKSLPGFVNRLSFQAIGRFHVLARTAPFGSSAGNMAVKELTTEEDLSGLSFDLHESKARAGVVIGDRGRAFVAWRFFRCPGVRYRVLVATDHHDSVKGMLAMRCTRKRNVPVSVLVDFLVDHTCDDAASIVRSLLLRAGRLAWKHFSPLMITLVNPLSYEGKVLHNLGFRRLPGLVLPHDTNFILRLHTAALPERLTRKLRSFEDWYFSFADYDTF
ncbi:MAG: hypothetical protein ABSH25_17055 [Syntrophorhabdales bacterium]